MSKARSVALHTLGCKLNYSETSAVERLLEAEGFEKRAFTERADVYVINTCSVTENADKECRQLVRRVQRTAPEALVVVMGCYAQLKPAEIAQIPGVDLVLGAAEKFNISTHLKELVHGDSTKICSCDIEDVEGFHSSFSLNSRTRTFLKVQDGCDYNCSFCTIPLARGKSRSSSVGNVLADIRRIAEAGVKEIVLTGINLGDFGKDGKGMRTGAHFHSLLQAIEDFEGVPRYRISSIEPNLLSDEIIQLVANSKKIMPHFHVPLQSGSDRILGMMRRRYRKALYAEKVSRIKSLLPDGCIGADVITGFPGETDEDFRETVDFVESLDIAYLHVFTYSERSNTAAPALGRAVPAQVRHERTKILRSLSFTKTRQFIASQNGQVRKVLFEGTNRDTMMEGYTDNYIRITTPYREEWTNQIVEWKIGG